MRIPHIINKNTRAAFNPSPETLDLIGEQDRKVVAENFEWDKNQCQPLEEICVKTIAKNFEKTPILDELPCSDKVYLLELLPINLPLELIISLIDDEYYWQRRYKETFRLGYRPSSRDWSWKTLYLERHVQQLIEQAEPQYNDEETFDEILSLCSPYITRLFVEELQAWKPPLTMEKEDIPDEWPIEHINMTPIFKKLSNITEFSLTYGVKNVGEDFKWDLFQISIVDCQRLGRALLELRDLKIVRIHRSNIDYKHCQALMQGLLRHKQIQELDLSHCDIGDAGALCVAYYLQDGTNLQVLNLANNKISNIGAEGLGYAMISGNCPFLNDLNLKMNPLGTNGIMGILRAIVRCTIPNKISLAACMFEEDTYLKICQMLKLNEILTNLDISSNWFGEQGGEELVSAMSINTCVEWLDTRETDISQAQREKLNEYCARNKKVNEACQKEDEDFATAISQSVYPFS